MISCILYHVHPTDPMLAAIILDYATFLQFDELTCVFWWPTRDTESICHITIHSLTRKWRFEADCSMKVLFTQFHFQNSKVWSRSQACNFIVIFYIVSLSKLRHEVTKHQRWHAEEETLCLAHVPQIFTVKTMLIELTFRGLNPVASLQLTVLLKERKIDAN